MTTINFIIMRTVMTPKHIKWFLVTTGGGRVGGTMTPKVLFEKPESACVISVKGNVKNKIK